MSNTVSQQLNQLENRKRAALKRLESAKDLYNLLKQDLAEIEVEIKGLKNIKDPKESLVKKELTKRNFVVAENKAATSAAATDLKKYSLPLELGDVIVEANSKIKIYEYNLTNDDLFDIFNGRKIFTIQEVSAFEGDGDRLYDTDSVVIAVITHISKEMKSSKGKSFVCITLSDLKGGFIRLFCADKVLIDVRKERIGAVVALLNPKVVKPSESMGSMGLSIDSSDLLLNLGKSADLSFCKSSDCQEIVNAAINKNGICATHRDAYYRNAKLQRQELAVGTAIFQIGPPTANGTKSLGRSFKKYATYSIYSECLVTEGLKFSVREPLKPTQQSVDKEKIEAMANMHGRGGELIRKSLGIEKEPVPCISTIFGPIALAKMNGNPHLNICKSVHPIPLDNHRNL